MTTAARPTSDSRCHWYTRTGEPMHTVIAKGTGEPRATTLKDARLLGLVPSVTTILRVLDKPELINWRIEQACLAVLTAPRLHAESLDEFVKRVLPERDQERDAAADLGSRIHAALSHILTGRPKGTEQAAMRPYIQPVLEYLSDRRVLSCERTVLGRGYCGTLDLMTQTNTNSDQFVDIWDFKTTRKLPEKSYLEARLQIAAYAEAFEHNEEYSVIDTYNVYISTAEAGKFVVHKNPPWMPVYTNGFEHLRDFWQWQNNYYPERKSVDANTLI